MSGIAYVVEGSTGEYSDHRDWLVRAFKTEEAAKAEVVRLTELADLYETKRMKVEDFWEVESDDAAMGAWIDANVPGLRAADPNFQNDYSGTRYRYSAVALEDR